MRIVRTPLEMQQWTRSNVSREQLLGFVPTMGALHAGHARLIEVARSECDAVVVSIFVNSLQFNRSDDFDSYPRTFESDAALCEALTVDAVYAPSADAMYSPSFQTSVMPGAVAAAMEGEGRPGHFAGVTTVVAKLFNAVMPNRAYFGRKDFQQLAVITQMVCDLDFAVDIVGVATVRENDGLALSSRNVRLSTPDRSAAPVLFRALNAARAAYDSGERRSSALANCALKVLASEPRARVEYAQVVDSRTCALVDIANDDSTIALAVWFGDVRLIDNLRFRD